MIGAPTRGASNRPGATTRVNLSFHYDRLFRNLAILAPAWGLPGLALWLRSRSLIDDRWAAVMALAGGVVAAGVALRTARRRRTPEFRSDSTAVAAKATWNQVADPSGNYANRWAMYQDLSAWFAARDWRGKAVAEFGHTNQVLRSFIPGANYTLLEYPEHDVQHLDRVASDGFDLAILDQTLEHVRDPERALDEVRRVLRPGGVAAVTTPFLVPLHGTEHYGDYTRWSPQGMQTMLERHGFDVEVRWWGNLPAAQAMLGHLHLKADEARMRRIAIEFGQNQENYPVTVWALATRRE
jgi:methyltransferase family protein